MVLSMVTEQPVPQDLGVSLSFHELPQTIKRVSWILFSLPSGWQLLNDLFPPKKEMTTQTLSSPRGLSTAGPKSMLHINNRKWVSRVQIC